MCNYNNFLAKCRVAHVAHHIRNSFSALHLHCNCESKVKYKKIKVGYTSANTRGEYNFGLVLLQFFFKWIYVVHSSNSLLSHLIQVVSDSKPSELMRLGVFHIKTLMLWFD